MNNQNKTKKELQKELKDLHQKFIYLNAIKDIDTAKRKQLEKELSIALQEIDIQNVEKEKRAAELIIANLELTFQNKEKVKRAAELVIANIELVFQNKEKAKRAAELVIANKELAFQNEEKKKRAAELYLAIKIAEDFKEKFSQIAENIDGIFWLKTNSEMIYVSPSFEKIWGVRVEELYKNPEIFTEKVHPDDKPAVLEIIQSNEFKDNKVFNYEFRIIQPDNQVRWVNSKTVPIIDDSGKIIKRVGIAYDITEKKQIIQDLTQAKKHAEQSDCLKTAFLANMSHEIRTPMNGILGFAELLKEPNLTGKEQQKYIRIIEKSGARMLNIINNIISISRIESGLMDVNISESNVNEQIEYIYTFYKPAVEGKGMQFLFKNSLPLNKAIIKIDPEKLFAILSNLIKNAIKYTDKGSIELGYDKKGEYLEFYVKDTGIGIDSNRQKAIFERFIQADISDKRAYQGAGLGLSISKAYVEMLGGKLWVESKKGKGSTFYFTIPFHTELQETAGTTNVTTKGVMEVQVNPKVSVLKILIVDDDETSDLLLHFMLKGISREILHAKSGVEAIELCRNNPDTDLILMDIKMPVMDGYETTRQIRQFNKDVIIIAQTAYGLTGDREKAIEAGCNEHLSKPFLKNKLLSLIQQYFIK